MYETNAFLKRRGWSSGIASVLIGVLTAIFLSFAAGYLLYKCITRHYKPNSERNARLGSTEAGEDDQGGENDHGRDYYQGREDDHDGEDYN
jgi:H+/gluconate symporter-like permease